MIVEDDRDQTWAGDRPVASLSSTHSVQTPPHRAGSWARKVEAAQSFSGQNRGRVQLALIRICGLSGGNVPSYPAGFRGSRKVRDKVYSLTTIKSFMI